MKSTRLHSGTSYLFAVLICALTLLSCLKEKRNFIEVAGTVTNKLTGKPFAGVPISILQCEQGIFLGSTPCGEVYRVVTDQNGRYYKKFEVDIKISYKLVAACDGPINCADYRYTSILKKNQYQEINFLQYPLTFATVRLQNKRHDRKFINLNLDDSLGFPVRYLYTAKITATDLDTSFRFRVESGRKYFLNATLYDGDANGNATNIYYQRQEIYKDDSDTSRYKILIQ